MVVSLHERPPTRSVTQSLQRRIDLLIGSSTPPYTRKGLDPFDRGLIDPLLESTEVEDADPLVSSDVEAAITEAFRRGEEQGIFGRHRRQR